MTESSAFFALAPRRWSGPSHTGRSGNSYCRMGRTKNAWVLRALAAITQTAFCISWIVHSALCISISPRFRSDKEIAVNCSKLHWIAVILKEPPMGDPSSEGILPFVGPSGRASLPRPSRWEREGLRALPQLPIPTHGHVRRPHGHLKNLRVLTQPSRHSHMTKFTLHSRSDAPTLRRSTLRRPTFHRPARSNRVKPGKT